MEGLLPRSNHGILDTINGLLGRLLEDGLVDALLVPMEVPRGGNVAQALVRDPARLAAAVPVSPVMPVNSATIVSNLTLDRGVRRVGAVLRSCEIRALVELVKLNQSCLDNLLIIGVDCPGTFTVADYASMVEASVGESRARRFLDEAMGDEGHYREGYALRTACRICERPVPEFGDILIGFLGTDPGEPLSVEVDERIAEGGLGRLGLLEGGLEKRQERVRRLVDARLAARDQALAEVRASTGSAQGLLNYFAACLTCHNCSVTCPICYCRQCVFTGPTFDYSSAQYMRRAARKGALRMPADTILYHLTRMNHMATSCVGCGQCESGCPSRLPLTAIFRSVGQKVQALYDYVPGRSLQEEPPVMTFREDELETVAR